MNSVSGVRALACASRTCRALASPYFFKPLRCEFRELVTNDGLEQPPIVSLSTANNFQTLKFRREPQIGGDRLMTIAQVLRVENTYKCFEYLPDRSSYDFDLSAPALDFLGRTLPLLSKLVIDLGGFIGYSTGWDQAHKKMTGKRRRYSHAPLSYQDARGLDIICAIARFQNLRDLTLHYKLQDDQLALMHPTPGCEAARELFESIQRRKRGQALVRLDVVFYTDSITIFGRTNRSWHIDPFTLSTTMTIDCNDQPFSQSGKQSQCRCTCDNPRYGKVIERRARTERLYGELAWMCRLGSVEQKLLQGKYRTFPWSIVMESLMWLALLPSSFIFEKGKRVRYELSLANVDVCYRTNFSSRRSHFKERLLEVILLYNY